MKTYSYLIGKRVLILDKDLKKILYGGILEFFGLNYFGRLQATISRCPIELDNENQVIEYSQENYIKYVSNNI